jgi:hypothetical protein
MKETYDLEERGDTRPEFLTERGRRQSDREQGQSDIAGKDSVAERGFPCSTFLAPRFGAAFPWPSFQGGASRPLRGKACPSLVSCHAVGVASPKPAHLDSTNAQAA